MQHAAGRVVLLLAVLLSPSAGTFAQAPPARRIQISSTPTCPRCTVELVPVRALKDGIDTLGPTNVNTHLTITADSRRNVIAVAEGERSLLVYDSTGRLLRVVGRAGQGPGEFELLREVRIGLGDSVWVIDSRRTTVYDPGMTRLARSFPRRGAPAVLLRDGGVIGYGNLAPNGSVPGPPLHAASPQGTETRSFGALPVPAASSATYPRAHIARAKVPGDVWLAWERRYQVELWDATGRQHLVLERALDWFPPWDAGGTPPGSPPGYGPRIISLHEDPRGRVWVAVMRVFESGVDPANPRDRPSPTRSEVVVEVLDPTTGTLVLSSRTVGFYAHVRDDLVGRYQETAEGYRYIELFRLVVTER